MDSLSTKRLAALVIVLAALCAYAWALRLRALEPPMPPPLALIPLSVAQYTAREEYVPPESLLILGADATVARSYRDQSGAVIELFIGYFAEQRERSQIHSPKHCYPGAGWNIISEGTLMLRHGGRREPVRELIISDGRQRRLVVYWFSMHGRTIPHEFALKWLQMTSALLARPQSAAFVRFSTVTAPGDEAGTRRRLVEFIEAVAPDITAALAPGAAAAE